MGVFKIIKMKRKTDAQMKKSMDDYLQKTEMDVQIKESMDDYFHKTEVYKHLKKGELANISDDDLRTAVMSWMWGKFDDNQYEVIESLPKPCRDVYASCTVDDEINNGGLNQLFFNSTKQFAKMAQEGFRDIGSEILSNIMETAIEIYAKNKELLEKYNDGTLESFSESYNENLFAELDNGFFEAEPKFDTYLQVYIRKNESVFGD